MAKRKKTVIPWLGDMPLPKCSRMVLKITNRDHVAAGLFMTIVKLDLSGKYAEGSIAITDGELAERLKCSTKTVQRKRSMLAPLGLEATCTWSEHHHEPHVYHYAFDVPKVREAFGLPVEKYVPDQSDWPDWAKDENLYGSPSNGEFLSKADNMSTYPFIDTRPEADTKTQIIDGEPKPERPSHALPGPESSEPCAVVPPPRTQKRAGKNRSEAYQRKKRSDALNAHVKFCGLGDTMLFADRRPEYDAFIAKHYDGDVVPRNRELASSAAISTHMKTDCQDPYLKLEELDYRTLGQLSGWLLSRPGRVYEADLRLIQQHLHPAGAVEFHYILRYVLSARKAVARMKKERDAESSVRGATR